MPISNGRNTETDKELRYGCLRSTPRLQSNRDALELRFLETPGVLSYGLLKLVWTESLLYFSLEK